MNKRFLSVVLVATMAAPTVGNAKSGGRKARTSEPASRVEIRLHDYAQVPEVTLKDAKKYVAAILDASGIEVIWHRCAPCPVNLEKAPECGNRRTASTLFLRVLPERMSKQILEDREVYGRALPGDGRNFGYLADVFYGRVEILAVRAGSPISLLLGVFMAHEIGHLLLGRDSHSERGIMSVPFDDLQVRRAVEGNLRFTRSEAKRIRTDVRRRHSADASTIQVRVYNYARVPGHILERAQKEVAHILRETGVNTTFAPCALTAEELDRFPQCNTARCKTDLVVAIVSEGMAKKMGTGHDVFGIAASSKDGFAHRASIFYHRVEQYADKWQASPSLLLGHFMAHEIGHLLLGADSHSRSGIMHVPWTKTERERIHQAGLLFTRSEGKRIREDIAKRLSGS